MAIQWYEDNQKTPVTFPHALGSFTKGDGHIQRIWLYNSGPESLATAKLKIEPVPGCQVIAWQIAKDYNGRPQAFIDYLLPMAFSGIPAYTWTPIWLKFNPELANENENPQTIDLRLTAELQV
jgi:hypothetical protein